MTPPDSGLNRNNHQLNRLRSGAGHRKPAIWRPLSILATATALILLLDLDLRFQHLFFTEEGGWWLGGQPLMLDLYEYGTLPAVGLAVAALLACLASLAFHRFRRWFRPALFLVLVMAIGPGLVVNALFKADFGRPRPWTVKEFGRHKEFLPLFHKGERNTGSSSFPSGHASMGFFLMAPYFILLGRRRRLARLVLIIGIIFGSMVGLARISSGDHFIGDVLWSWGFVYFSGLGCYYLLRFNKQPVEWPWLRQG